MIQPADWWQTQREFEAELAEHVALAGGYRSWPDPYEMHFRGGTANYGDPSLDGLWHDLCMHRTNEMITFLPYPDFAMTASVLDNKRLGKQRVECRMVLNALTGFNVGWRMHPATVMWEGHLNWLLRYHNAITREWIARGYRHAAWHPFYRIVEQYDRGHEHLDRGVYPPWLGMEKLHSSHRAALLAKNPDWYSRFGWTEEPKIEYFWPVKHFVR